MCSYTFIIKIPCVFSVFLLLAGIFFIPLLHWLVVSTHLKNIGQNGNLPQIGVKIKNIWNHHLVHHLFGTAFLHWFFLYMQASQPQPMAHLGSKGPMVGMGSWEAPRGSANWKKCLRRIGRSNGILPRMAVSNELYISIHRLFKTAFWHMMVRKMCCFQWEKNVSDTNYANLQCLAGHQPWHSGPEKSYGNSCLKPAWSAVEFWNPREYLKFSIHLQALPFGPK